MPVVQIHHKVSHKKNTGFKLVCAPEARQKHLHSVLKHCGSLPSKDALNVIYNAISPNESHGIPQTSLSKASSTSTGNQSPRETKSFAWEPSSFHCLSEQQWLCSLSNDGTLPAVPYQSSNTQTL